MNKNARRHIKVTSRSKNRESDLSQVVFARERNLNVGTVRKSLGLLFVMRAHDRRPDLGFSKKRIDFGFAWLAQEPSFGLEGNARNQSRASPESRRRRSSGKDLGSLSYNAMSSSVIWANRVAFLTVREKISKRRFDADTRVRSSPAAVNQPDPVVIELSFDHPTGGEGVGKPVHNASPRPVFDQVQASVFRDAGFSETRNVPP